MWLHGIEKLLHNRGNRWSSEEGAQNERKMFAVYLTEEESLDYMKDPEVEFKSWVGIGIFKGVGRISDRVSY